MHGGIPVVGGWAVVIRTQYGAKPDVIRTLHARLQSRIVRFVAGVLLRVPAGVFLFCPFVESACVYFFRLCPNRPRCCRGG